MNVLQMGLDLDTKTGKLMNKLVLVQRQTSGCTLYTKSKDLQALAGKEAKSLNQLCRN